MSILIVGSILSIFILMVYMGDKSDMEGLEILGTIGIFCTVIFGGIYTVAHTSNTETVSIEVVVAKSPHKAYVEWVNFDGVDRLTEYNKHKEYMEIDSCTIWKADINTNDWGYSWSDYVDLIYENIK